MAGSAEGSEAPVLGDAELITAVRSGDADAYGVLYERHAGATWAVARQYTNTAADAEDVVAEAFIKVLAVLMSGGGPDVAFRAYIFTTARRLGMQRVQGARRVETTDDTTVLEAALDPELSTEHPALADFERGVVAQAYRTLPERWQAVLWYTEVEALPPAQIAPLLGLSANGVAALAYRAREGLRQAYLQQHLQEPLASGCRTIAGKLGAYVRDGLAARETAQVEQHLEGCGDCRALLLELGDVNHGMRAVIAPLVLGVLGVGALAQPLPVGGGIAAGAAALAGGAAGIASSAAASAGVATSATGAVSSSAVTSGVAATSGAAAGGATAGVAGAPVAAAAGGGGAAAASTGAGAVVAGAGATTAATGVVAASTGGIAALLGSVPLAVVGIAAAALVAVAGVAVAGVLGVFSGGGPDASDISSLVEVTATSEPSATSSPSASPTSTPTAEPATPTPTVSAAPRTATPTVTASARPPVAQAAVAEPAPTPTTSPTSTPEPTAGPQATPTPTADPTVGPTRAPARLSLPADSGPVVLVADGEVQQVGVDITNLGEVDATGLLAVVTLPAGTEVAGTTAQLVAARSAAVLPAVSGRFAAAGAGGAWVCVGEQGTASATCSLTRLEAGATATLSVPVVVDEDALGSDGGYVEITVTGDDLAPQQLRAEVRVQRQARLDVSASVAAIDLVEGQQGEVRVRVANTGGVAARSVRVLVTRPEGTVWADDPVGGEGWACDVTGGTATCARATIAAGDTQDVVLRLRAAAGTRPGPLAAGVRVEASATAARGGRLDVPVDVRGSRLAFGDAPVVQLVEGRTGRAAFTVTNTGNHPADAVTALVTLPAHVLADLGGASGSTVGCVAVGPRLVRCDLGVLDPGAVVPVMVGARALGAGSGDVVVTVSGGTGSSITGRAPAKVTSGGLSPRFASGAGWAVTQVGAPLLTCTDSTACTRALAGTASLDNNSHVMRPLNAAGGAYVSSSTRLDVPAGREVAFAGLYWSANRGADDAFRGDLECVSLRAPGEKTYADVEGEVLAEVTDGSGRTYYQSFADVTEHVRAGGSGTWSLADAAVAATRRDPVPTYYAGWALVVVYAEPGTGTATVYDGGAWVGQRASDAPTFTFAAEVGASARIGVVAWEGDRGTTGDELRLDGVPLTPWRSGGTGPVVAGAANNAFDSTATGWSLPNSLGVDVKAFADTVLTKPLTTLTPTTTGDQYLIGAVTVQTR